MREDGANPVWITLQQYSDLAGVHSETIRRKVSGLPFEYREGQHRIKVRDASELLGETVEFIWKALAANQSKTKKENNHKATQS